MALAPVPVGPELRSELRRQQSPEAFRSRAFFVQRVVFHLRPAFAVAPSDADVDRHACVALAETDCVAGHVGFEPANPSASHLVGFA